jgi:predicted HTH domain antitoxin
MREDVIVANRSFQTGYNLQEEFKMPIVIEMPSEMETHLRKENPDIDQKAREAVALDLFRREKITLFEFGKMLGMDRHQADEYLAVRKEYAQCLTREEIDSDRQTLEKVLHEMGR